MDDYSLAICGYMDFTGAPLGINTALALRQAIWRKTDPAWAMCGLAENCPGRSRDVDTVSAGSRIKFDRFWIDHSLWRFRQLLAGDGSRRTCCRVGTAAVRSPERGIRASRHRRSGAADLRRTIPGDMSTARPTRDN